MSFPSKETPLLLPSSPEQWLTPVISGDGNKKIRVILNYICIVPGQLGLHETMTSNTVRSSSPGLGAVLGADIAWD